MSEDQAQPMELDWTFGFTGQVLNLSTARHKTLFYAAGHTGVIYDMQTQQQRALQGHLNKITACTVSRDKRWLVTADCGEDSILIVWDTLNGNPVKTFPRPHGSQGIAAMDMSADLGFLVTVSDSLPQTLSIWDWTAEGEVVEPVHTAAIDSTDLQTCVKFNPKNAGYVVCNGAQDVFFWQWDTQSIQVSVANLSNVTMAKATTALTQSIFVPAAESLGVSKYASGHHSNELEKLESKAVIEKQEVPEFDVLTATTDGDVYLWQKPRYSTSDDDVDSYHVAKVVRLHEHCINVLTTIGEYIVSGGAEGFIRFYDFQFRLVAWFEDLGVTKINSIAFDYFNPKRRPSKSASAAAAASKRRKQATVSAMTGMTTSSSSSSSSGMHGGGDDDDLEDDQEAFDAPNLVASSDTDIIMVPSSLFDSVEAEYRPSETIIEGLDGAVAGIDTHPIVPVLAVAGHLCGPVQLWDYERRELIHSWVPGGTKRKRGSHLNPVCVKFDPSGELLAVAFQDGGLKLLTTNNFEVAKAFKMGDDEKEQHVAESIVFSPDGAYIATANHDCSVGIYHLEEVVRRDPELGEEYRVLDWNYLGRYKSHYKPITGLLFSKGESGNADDVRLLSVGTDRYLVEYDLANSSLVGGIKLKTRTRLEKTAVPTAVCLHPHTSKEDFVLTANDEFKFKLYNTNNKMARRTVLGPTFGGPLRQMVMLPLPDERKYLEDQAQYMVYATEERVVGLTKFPLDGNPNKSMGMIAHPGPVGMGIACSNDGRYLFTSGVTDRTVNMWAVNTDALDAQEEAGGDGLEPYISLIEGGRHGDFYQEMHEYFYYAQLQAQGENTTGNRRIADKVSLSEIPNLMRALGYYPTEKEILDMHNEVKYDKFVESGEYVENVTFPEFLKLYVNHRPVLGIGANEVEDMLLLLGATRDPKTGELALDKDKLFAMLQGQGEIMSEMELRKCLQRLLPEDKASVAAMPDKISTEFLAEEILGFEVVDEPEPQSDVQVQVVSVDD